MYEKSIGAMKGRMPVLEYNCYENKPNTDRLYSKGVRWFTNSDYAARHEDIVLYKHYTPEEYPHYDNYDAIEVSKTADIPCDYYEEMGVPITYLDKHNPDQFDIVGSSRDLGRPMKRLGPAGRAHRPIRSFARFHACVSSVGVRLY